MCRLSPSVASLSVLWLIMKGIEMITTAASLSKLRAILETNITYFYNKAEGFTSTDGLQASWWHIIMIFYWPAWLHVTYYCGCTALLQTTVLTVSICTCTLSCHNFAQHSFIFFPMQSALTSDSQMSTIQCYSSFSFVSSICRMSTV